jgi:hypothetical protein
MECSLVGNISIRVADPHFAIFHAKPSCESIWIAASAAVTN